MTLYTSIDNGVIFILNDSLLTHQWLWVQTSNWRSIEMLTFLFAQPNPMVRQFIRIVSTRRFEWTSYHRMRFRKNEGVIKIIWSRACLTGALIKQENLVHNVVMRRVKFSLTRRWACESCFQVSYCKLNKKRIHLVRKRTRIY